jgi:hypothetical protein
MPAVDGIDNRRVRHIGQRHGDGSPDRGLAESRQGSKQRWCLGALRDHLGVYSWFWWYFVKCEMRDFGRARNVSGLGDNPWLSRAAWTVGAWLLYVPFVWTIVTTSMRIGRSQRVACDQQTFNGWIAGLLWVFTLGIVEMTKPSGEFARAAGGGGAALDLCPRSADAQQVDLLAPAAGL